MRSIWERSYRAYRQDLRRLTPEGTAWVAAYCVAYTTLPEADPDLAVQVADLCRRVKEVV